MDSLKLNRMITGLFFISFLIIPNVLAQSLDYKILDCNQSKNIGINLEHSGNTVKFTQVLGSYCNFKDSAKVELEINGNDLIIRSIFNSDSAAKCVCKFEILGSITELKEGDYNLKFVYNNKHTNQSSLEGQFSPRIICGNGVCEREEQASFIPASCFIAEIIGCVNMDEEQIQQFYPKGYTTCPQDCPNKALPDEPYKEVKVSLIQKIINWFKRLFGLE